MTCEEFLELSAAFALGILDPAERTACVGHLADPQPHRGCAIAVQEAQAVAAQLAGGVPARAPSPQLWRAIEARISDLPRDPAARRRVWRELAGWFVAAAVIGFYLYSAPAETRRQAIALEGAPSAIRDAMGLMTSPGTRLVVFAARRAEAGRATVILSPTEHRAVVLCDRVPPQAARRLRLWAVRGEAPPAPLIALTMSDDGVAMAQLGATLFEPTGPDRLVISSDGPEAAAPGDVLLTAQLR
jgi:anti-sigma-K factor RskA